MNKKALVEFVRVSILKYEAVADHQKTLHFKRVEQGVGYAFDTLLSQIKMDTKGKASIESYYVKHYYNQPVKESNDYRYFGVSDEIAPVGEGRGIWYVQPSGGGSPFPFSHRPHISMFANMAVGEALNMTTWRFGNIATDKQIVLETIGNSATKDIRKVDYGVVRSFSSYGDSEEIIIPDGRNDLILELTTKWLSPIYDDKVNNNI